jgi:hypothetical protein
MARNFWPLRAIIREQGGGMQADWTKREVSELMRKFYDVANLGATMVERMAAVMDFASDVVSLFLARASGQVKEDVERVHHYIHRKAPVDVDAALSRLSALAQEAASLRAKVAGLENEAVEAKDHATLWRKERDRLIKDYDAARSEVERLKGLLDLAQRKTLNDAKQIDALESRLASIRERGLSVERDAMGPAYDVVRWVLEGDAPAATLRVVSGGTPEELKALQAMGVQVLQETKLTRDVGTGSLATDDPAQEVAKFASVDRVAALAKEAGAKNGREVAAFHAGHKAGVAEGLALVRHVVEMPEIDPSDDGDPNQAEWQAAADLQAAHDRGAEAMREALLLEAKAACDQHGVGWLYQHLERRFKGATP